MADMSYCARDLQRINEDLNLTENTSGHEMVAALLLIVYCSEYLLEHAESIIDFAENLRDEKYSLAIRNAKLALHCIFESRVIGCLEDEDNG